MPEFFQSCACKGAQPRHLALRNHIQRPQLTARMLQQRSVPRCIVAPAGFGKTGLAFDYANTVFGMQHTFWVDASSPSFIRDLDKSCVRKHMNAVDNQPYLAVFEDVPRMDGTRAAAFCDEVNLMLDEGNEVLITCEPGCDTLSEDSERIVLKANDLLLSDAELRQLDGNNEPSCKSRVAALAWGSEAGRARFLCNIVGKGLAPDVQLVLLVMLVMQKGRLSDVAGFTGCAPGLAESLSCDYPNLGIDRHSGCFDAGEFTLDEIAAAFMPSIDELAACSLYASEDMLAKRLCDLLLSRGLGERACATLCAFGSEGARAGWLASNAAKLYDTTCWVPACRLYGYLVEIPPHLLAELAFEQARRLLALGDIPLATKLVHQLAYNTDAPLLLRFKAAMLSLYCYQEEGCIGMLRLAQKLFDSIVFQRNQPDVKAIPTDIRGLGEGEMSDARVALGMLEVLFQEGVSNVSSGLISAVAKRLVKLNGSAGLGLFTLVLANALLKRGNTGLDGLAALAAQVCRSFSALLASAPSQVASAKGNMLCKPCWGFAVLAARDVCTGGKRARGAGVLSDDALALMQAFEARLQQQRRAYAALPVSPSGRAAQECARPLLAAPPGLALRSPVSGEAKCTVNLFGGLDVSVGGIHIGEKQFHRRKARTLLGLLVLHRGRELSRPYLAAMMWPGADRSAALKSLYPVVSNLRKIMSDESGACPYIVSGYDGISIDADLLHTDLDDFNDVCSKLLFDAAECTNWGGVYKQVAHKFSGELLPSELQCSEIIEKRKHYRNRLVDALVSASRRLLSAGDTQMALMFAQQALLRDHAREDIYIALMRAQIAADQRTAALQTYFDCRTQLVESLGIDPCPQTVELYRSIIEEQEEF